MLHIFVMILLPSSLTQEIRFFKARTRSSSVSEHQVKLPGESPNLAASKVPELLLIFLNNITAYSGIILRTTCGMCQVEQVFEMRLR